MCPKKKVLKESVCREDESQRFRTKMRSQWDPNGLPKPCAPDAKHRLVKRADGIPLATSVGDLITADYTILNLENESINDHTNAVIVQDGCSYWIRSYLSKKVRMRQKEQSCLHEVHGSILKTWEYIQMYTDNFEGVHQNVTRAVNGLTTRRLIIAQEPMVSQRELSDE